MNVKEKLKQVLIRRGIVNNNIYSYSTPEELFEWNYDHDNKIELTLKELESIIEEIQKS